MNLAMPSKPLSGPHSVDDYTIDFYSFLAHTELNESSIQLVSRYIGGLCLQFQLQDTLNMFNPLTIAAAHQSTSQVEK